MNLADKARKMPQSSGVYLFMDKKGGVLYVGRAVSLRRRVLNYFQKRLDPRISEMVGLARDLKFYETDTLLEAIILEANLIKKYWPKYNIREKDNRSFVYFVIPKTEYPQPIIVRERELNKSCYDESGLKTSPCPPPPRRGNAASRPPHWRAGRGGERFKSLSADRRSVARIFGPYQSSSLLRNALKIIRRIFPYSSSCKPFSGKPCFDSQIGLCPGLCTGAISKKDYQKNIKNIILLLSGQKKRLLDKLARENPEKVKALKHIQDVSLLGKDDFEFSPTSPYPLLRQEGDISVPLLYKGVIRGDRIEGYDISHFAGKETYGAMTVFINGKPDKTQYRLFKIKKAPDNDDLRALEEMITRRMAHAEWQAPDLILIDGGKPQIDYIYKILNSLNINIPLVGLSKFGNDKLIFPLNTSNDVKSLAKKNKSQLLALRDEAHRFGLKASRRKRKTCNLKSGI